MKWEIVTLFMTAALLQAAMAFGGSDSTISPGPDIPVFFKFGMDSKKVGEKMAEALASFDSHKSAGAKEYSNDNISINSSLSNSSSLNYSAINANSSANLQSVGPVSSGGSGYYGMTASRHEIGKSGIDSRMFLSGNFEMDRAVKFQDQGVD